MALFSTHELQKDGMVIFFVVFQKSEISKNAVSERCSDSRLQTESYVADLNFIIERVNVCES